MVPCEILEDIFTYLSRDALDHCEITCLKWSKVIETSKRLTQRRIVSLDYHYHYANGRWLHKADGPFWVQLKSSTGKTIRIEYNLERSGKYFTSPVFKNIIIDELGGHSMIEYNIDYENLASPVFKNVIIDELVEQSMGAFLERSSQIFEWASFRIIVKRVRVFLDIKTRRYENDTKRELLKRLHDSLTEYIDADEITMEIFDDKDEVLFNKESWKYFDLGKKTEFNLHYHSLISLKDFYDDTFKEFISGKHMEHSKLNELEIYFHIIDRHIIVHLIVEAFCNTDEPLKFFKSIKTLRSRNFDKILGEFGFVHEDQKPHKYRLSHQKLKWALEATEATQRAYKCLKFQLIEL